MANVWTRLAALSVSGLSAEAVTTQPLTWSVVRCIHNRHANASKAAHSGSSEESHQETEIFSENDTVTPEFTNRNPRNLEKMALAYKDKGWYQSHPRKNYWHKLFVERTGRHVSAWVEHVSGHVPIQASTEEWAIKKHLYSTSDVVARRNLGRVIAQRSLEAGLEYMVCALTETDLSTEGNKAFYDAMVEGGITFEEPKTICNFVKKHDYLPDDY